MRLWNIADVTCRTWVKLKFNFHTRNIFLGWFKYGLINVRFSSGLDL